MLISCIVLNLLFFFIRVTKVIYKSTKTNIFTSKIAKNLFLNATLKLSKYVNGCKSPSSNNADNFGKTTLKSVQWFSSFAYTNKGALFYNIKICRTISIKTLFSRNIWITTISDHRRDGHPVVLKFSRRTARTRIFPSELTPNGNRTRRAEWLTAAAVGIAHRSRILQWRTGTIQLFTLCDEFNINVDIII